MASNFYEAFARGQANGLERQRAVTQRNQLAELQSLAPQVMGGNLDATSRAYALDPQTAQSYQTEGNRQQQQLVGLAKTLKQSEGNPQLQAAVYNSAIPYLSRSFGEGNIPKVWDSSVVMPIVDQVLAVAQNAPSMGGAGGTLQSQRVLEDGSILNTYRDGRTENTGLKADRQMWLRDNPGMPPELVGKDQIARPVVTGGAAPAPTRSDMEADISLANAMIAAGIPDTQVDAFLASRGSRGGSAPVPATTALARPSAAQDAAAVESAKIEAQLAAAERVAQAEANAARLKKGAEIEVQQQGERDAAGATRLRDAQETVSVLQEALPLLDTATGSGLGAIRDAGAAFVGRATDGAKANASLRVLATRLTAKVPRFEGPQSDKDVAEYKAAAGDLANDSLPVEIRRAAGMTLQRLSQKAIAQAQATGQRTAQPQGSAPRQIQSAEEYNALPPGALFIAPDGTQRRKR